MRELSGMASKIVYLISLAWAIYLLISVLYPVHSIQMSAICTGIALVLCFLLYPVKRNESPSILTSILDYACILGAVIACGYHAVHYEFYLLNPTYSSTVEIILGTILIVLIIEAARRAVGWIIPLLAIIIFIYAYLGPYFPGLFTHRGYSHTRIIEVLYLGTRSYSGLLTTIMTTMISLFIIFGAMLMCTGASEAITNIANLIGGKYVGGAAKVSVIASALFGTISGSAVSNVAVTGSFTIPMMKSQGYRSELAGAIEAAASTGGQFMPPVMGAGAFIMAEILGVPYIEICIAAALPAILYFLGVGAGIHFEALRINLGRLPKEMIPNRSEVFNIKTIGPLVISVGTLLYFLLIYYTPSFAAFMATMSVIAVYFMIPPWKTYQGKGRVKNILDGLSKGATSLVGLFCLLVCVQLIVSLISLTGIGVKISAAIIDLSYGNFFMALILSALAALLLGMGLPTTAAYVLAGAVLGRVLINMGIDPLVAHLFIFFYAIISVLTPPVCAAVYVASGIAQSDWLRTAGVAVRLAIPAYLVPFYFVFNQELLMKGSPISIILAGITSVIGVIVLAAGVMGFFLKRTNIIERFIFITAAFLLIKPGLVTDLMGIALFTMGYLIQRHAIGKYSRKQKISDLDIGG